MNRAEVHADPIRLPDEAPALAAWLASDEWPFHGTRRPTVEKAAGWIADGLYTPSFWLRERPGADPVGVVALRELEDPTPVFDLRLRSSARGRGLGRAALGWLARHVFETLGQHDRIEAHTRADNAAMRRTLRACRWVQEAHHRRCWPDAEGGRHDAVTYALLKDDWRSGTTTPVPPLDR